MHIYCASITFFANSIFGRIAGSLTAFIYALSDIQDHNRLMIRPYSDYKAVDFYPCGLHLCPLDSWMCHVAAWTYIRQTYVYICGMHFVNPE